MEKRRVYGPRRPFSLAVGLAFDNDQEKKQKEMVYDPRRPVSLAGVRKSPTTESVFSTTSQQLTGSGVYSKSECQKINASAKFNVHC